MFYADKAHDNRSVNQINDLNIELAINIRKNASVKIKKGCPLRRHESTINQETWDMMDENRLKDTGKRRLIVEIVFSSIKKEY